MGPAEGSASFEEISQEFSGPLLGYISRCVGDRDLAGDLLQETLIRINRGLENFEGRSSIKTWAFSIATRVVADHFRRPDHRLSIIEIDDSLDLSNAERAVDDRLVIDEMSACVRQVIDSLPEDYRSALVLHDLEDLTAIETAEICGCSVATAKIRIHRARSRLKEALQRECKFYRDGDNVLRCDRKS